MLYSDAPLEPKYSFFQLLLVMTADDSKLSGFPETAYIGKKLVHPSHTLPQGQPMFND